MAISVQNVVVLLLSTLLIAVTVFLFTSDNNRFPFPFPSLSTDDDTPNPKSSVPQNVDNVSSDPTPQNNKKLKASQEVELEWDLCKGAGSVDYIPCLDNYNAIKQLKSRRHMEHRERHCPEPTPKCLVPLPDNYKPPVPWPKSRDMVRDRSWFFVFGKIWLLWFVLWYLKMLAFGSAWSEDLRFSLVLSK